MTQDKDKHSNFFDSLQGIDIEAAAQQEVVNRSNGEKLDHLIHQVFAQSPEGAELLALWKETLIMTPTADSGMDNITIGIGEGFKRFIRSIIITIKRVEATNG